MHRDSVVYKIMFYLEECISALHIRIYMHVHDPKQQAD